MTQQSEMVIIIRPSFKKVCGPDACRAGLYNHILYRLAKKAKNEPEKDVRKGNIFWFASAEDICQDIDEAWCVNKVRKEIKQLVDAGLLGQRHNPIKKWDRKFQYFLSEEQGKKLLEKCEAEGVCLLHIGLNAEVLHLLHMVNAFNKNGGCICQKEEMELPNMGNASTINGGAIPEGSQPKGSTEGSLSEGEEESNSESTDTHTIVSSDTAHADSFQDEQVFTDEEQRDTLRVLQEAGIVPFETPQGDDHAVTAAGHSHRLDDTAACGDTTSHSAVVAGQVAPPEDRPVLEAQQETLAETPTTPTPAQPLSLPQAEQAALGQGKGKKATLSSLAAKCDTREIQRRINENRGYALEEDVEIIRERKAIKTWCNLHTLEDFDPVVKYLTTVDPYWRKPENRNRIGGLTLLKETSRVKSELEKLESRRKPGNITLLPPNGRDLAARSRALREQYAGVRS